MPDKQPPLFIDYPRSTDDPQRSLQRAYERINALQRQLASLPPSLTPDQIKALIGPAANSALSLGGTNPLFITEIVGGDGIPQILSGTHAIRLTAYPANTIAGSALYFETDRTVYYQTVSGVWTYSSGRMTAPIASLPADLGTADAGFLFYASDYQHTYTWDGAAWSYAPGDEGSGRIVHFTVAPRSGKWQLCDGSAGVRESLANGTTALVAFSGLAAGVVPNLTGTPSYLRFSSACTGVINAATAPAFTGTAATLTGTISAPTLTMNSYTPAGTNSAPVFTGNAIALTSSTVTAVGAVAVITSVAASITTFTPTGTVTAPTFTGDAATLTGTVSAPLLTMNSYTPAGTIAATAQPRNLDTLPYLRL